MKVIKVGCIRQKECPNCYSLLEYNIKSNDVLTDTKKIFTDIKTWKEFPQCYIICPICHKKIDVSEDVCDFKWSVERHGL